MRAFVAGWHSYFFFIRCCVPAAVVASGSDSFGVHVRLVGWCARAHVHRHDEQTTGRVLMSVSARACPFRHRSDLITSLYYGCTRVRALTHTPGIMDIVVDEHAETTSNRTNAYNRECNPTRLGGNDDGGNSVRIASTATHDSMVCLRVALRILVQTHTFPVQSTKNFPTESHSFAFSFSVYGMVLVGVCFSIFRLSECVRLRLCVRVAMRAYRIANA